MAGKRQANGEKERKRKLFGANMKNNKAEITDTLSDTLKTRVK